MFASAASEGAINTKLRLLALLLRGCLSLLTAMFEAWSGTTWVLSPRGWREGAIACWLLAVANRAVYPAPANQPSSGSDRAPLRYARATSL